MRIGTLDTDQRVLVVAEIGNNHEGHAPTAIEMVRRAADCGVDAVKVQVFRTEHYISRRDQARFARLKSFELSIEQFTQLADEARRCGLLFIATPFDLHSALALEAEVDAYKIASGDVTFFPLLRAVARTGMPVLMSSGASTIDEIRTALEVVRSERSDGGVDAGLAVLHCVSSYPTPPDEANLGAIAALGRSLHVTPGYSDHVIGNEAASCAVAAGARIVEKHFTLDKHRSDFRDHQLSADPHDLRDLVDRIRRVEAMIGSGEKRVQPSEAANRDAIRRSVVITTNQSAGHRLTADDITWTRPGGGLAPGDESALFGRRLVRDLREGERLMRADVE